MQGDGASSGVKPSVDPKRTRPTVVDSPDVSDDDVRNKRSDYVRIISPRTAQFDTVTTGQLPPEDKSIPLPETDPGGWFAPTVISKRRSCNSSINSNEAKAIRGHQEKN